MEDAWDAGGPYERFMGRWSRLLGDAFVDWLPISAGAKWIDVGCGSGALSAAILEHCAPAELVALDQSDGFVETARRRLGDRAQCLTGNAMDIPLPDSGFERTVSGLVLNFIPQPEKMLGEMRRITRPGGIVAVYVWDYGGVMELLTHFWESAIGLDPGSAEQHEARRFPEANATGLARQFERSGLAGAVVEPITIETRFDSFDDYWAPFLGGQGPAGSYVASLDDAHRSALREHLRARLPAAADGSLRLRARAWCARAGV